MTDRTVRFIRNLRFVLHGLSVEELYQVALGMRDEIARRDLDCGPEAKALTAALLVHARVEHAAVTEPDSEYDRAGIVNALRDLGGIYSSDCTAAPEPDGGPRRWDGLVSPLADDGEGV